MVKMLLKTENSSFLKQRETEEWEVKSAVWVVYGLENDGKKRGERKGEWWGWWHMRKMRVLMQSKKHMKMCNGKEKKERVGAGSINFWGIGLCCHQSRSHLSIE